MNDLEKHLAKQNWVLVVSEKQDAFTTVWDGIGFVLFNYNNVTYLIGLSKVVTEEQLKCHGTKAPYIIGFWAVKGAYYTKRMFTVQASADFIGAVVLSAFPELQRIKDETG